MKNSDNAFSCRVCEKNSINPVFHKVPGATRLLKDERYTVWICQHCQSINAHETVDYKYVYENYPIQKQNYDFFAKVIFSNRLRLLKKVGFKKNHSLIDYGCGSGLFVRYLRERGYLAEGYEPFNKQFNSPHVLSKKYDFVVSQDVIEHIDKPQEFLQQMKKVSHPGSVIAVGTPYADNISLTNRKDQVGSLHQPFHRFIVSKNQIKHLFTDPGWEISQIIEKYYVDTLFPFVNEQFLLSYFKVGGYLMDVGFEPIQLINFFKHPELLVTGLFGGFFTRKQNVLVVLKVKDPEAVEMERLA